MTKDILDKYIWLVDTIHQAGRITLAEINEKWHRSPISDGRDIPLRTFHNWKNAIQDTFDINIECDRRSGYRYYIEHPEDMTNGAMRTWLLNTFTVNNIINESRSLSRRILFENVPSGQKYLTSIIEAMQKNLEIRLVHESYWHDGPSAYTVQPWCLKIFNQRWYVSGYCHERNAFRTFSLDRIQELTVLDTTFEYPKDFNPEEYFADFFGIITSSEIGKEIIRIKAYGLQVNYLRSLPLHHSQKETEKDSAGEWAVFEYRLRPATDFVFELLKHGNQLEVLSPLWLRESIASDIREMAARYK